MHAAELSTTPGIVTLLLEKGAELEARSHLGVTPLMFAVANSQTTEIATLLIEAGADVNAKANGGHTMLMNAETPEIIKILKAAGANE
jgi:ankyrin repeat protein